MIIFPFWWGLMHCKYCDFETIEVCNVFFLYFNFLDNGDILLASAAQDFLIRVWRFSPRQTDTGKKVTSIMDLPLDKDIQMRENTFTFTYKGRLEIIRKSLVRRAWTFHSSYLTSEFSCRTCHNYEICCLVFLFLQHPTRKTIVLLFHFIMLFLIGLLKTGIYYLKCKLPFVSQN